MPDDIPVVLLTNDDVVRILAGSAMGCETADGQKVTVRLMTPDEFLAANAKGRKWMEDNGLRAPEPATRADAERITAPFDLFEIVGRR